MDFFLDQLKTMCDCPVYEVALKTKAGKYWPGASDFNPFPKFKYGKIELSTYLTPPEKIGTLAHEIGHERCYTKGCICCRQRIWFLTEVHAELYALHLLLRYRKRKALETRLVKIQYEWPQCAEIYVKAGEIVQTRKIYTRCQEFCLGGLELVPVLKG